MIFLRMTMVCALLWGAGLQHAKAGDLFSKEDSLELVKMYQDYEAARESARQKMFSNRKQLDSSDPLYSIKYDEILGLYKEELDSLKKEFDASLVADPRFAKVVRLRNLLQEYKEELKAAKPIWKEQEKLYWDKKFVQLIQDNPLFMEYPEIMFQELNNGFILDDYNHVVTSADGRIRYYNLTTTGYGTRPTLFFRQYRTDDGKVLVSWDGDDTNEQVCIKSIHIFKTNDRELYLLEYEPIGEVFSYIVFSAVAIEGDDIIQQHLFDTSDGNLVVKYDGAEWKMEHLGHKEKSWIINYDEARSTIFVRKYKDEKLCFLSEDSVSYTFNGEKFVRSYYEDVDNAINEVMTSVETGILFQDKKTLLEQPYEILSEFFKDEKYAFSDKSLVKDMKDRIKRKEPVAQILYLGAAEKGDMIAQYKLGKCYCHGYMGVPKDAKKARIWLEKAANQGHVLAQRYMQDVFHDHGSDDASAEYVKDFLQEQKSKDIVEAFAKLRENNENDWQRFENSSLYIYLSRNIFLRLWEKTLVIFFPITQRHWIIQTKKWNKN